MLTARQGVEAQVQHNDPNVSLELSDREKFGDIFRILGSSFGPIFLFRFHMSIILLLTSASEVSQAKYGDITLSPSTVL